MSRPSLIVQTACFDPSDREPAARLGGDLYQQLTRPRNDPLAHGPGIPAFSAVTPEHVAADAADVVLLVPVLGKTTFAIDREKVVATVQGWHDKLGAGHVLPVPTATAWCGVEDQLPGVSLLTELYGPGDRRRRTMDEIVLGLTRLLTGNEAGIQLFLSHAKADLPATDEAAKLIHDHVVTDTTGAAFFDTRDLLPGHDLEQQLERATGHGLLVVVRGDAYSSRPWCQRELLLAKRCGLPTLTVEILCHGEPRSSAYGGNGPSVVWEGRPELVVSRAMVECARAAAFRSRARRVIRAAGMPVDTVVLCRPPELLDLAQGPLDSARPRVAVYPDPELPVVERDLLHLGNPRLSLVTPTTAYRRVLERGALANPLDGVQVAMSLAKSPNAGGDEGFTEHHVCDATAYLARCLVSAGAAIGYGGDFRDDSYTELLGNLITAYNQTAAEPSDLLHSYLSALIALDDLPDDLMVTVHHLGHGDFACRALVPPPTAEPGHPEALYVSDMRRVMAEDTQARVILGGKTQPRTEKDGPGYGGRYPGVIEEAWRTLAVGKPLYVLGGFGGAAALVADLLDQEESTPRCLQDGTWLAHELFDDHAAAIDADPYRRQLGLPRRMEDLAQAVRELGAKMLDGDQAARAWNGLTVEQNRALFRSRDPVTIASLVVDGLLEVSRRHAEGKLRIELVHGNITEARDLESIAVAAFDDVPLGGAGAALDRALSGRASSARAQGRALMSLESKRIDADWLYLASLGPLADLDDLHPRIAAASRDTAELVRRHGFRRLGVVAFGGTLLKDVDPIVTAMLEGLAEIAGTTTLVWFENDKQRAEALRERLRQDARVSVTTRQTKLAATTVPMSSDAELLVHVRLEDAKLVVTALPPAGTGVARTQSIELDRAKLETLSGGQGMWERSTPPLDELDRRGKEIGELLFGDDSTELLARCREAKVTVVHDVPASRLPFELLLVEPASQEPVRPATGAGMNRRLAVSGVPLAQLFGKPSRTGSLRVLVVVNPTGDLHGAEAEAKTVREILAQDEHIELVELRGVDATRDRVLKAMAGADVLHYSGHAFFNGPGDDQNGLELHDGALTFEDIRGRSLPVRLAFVNACESARVRGPVQTEAAAFAEMFLRSGIEAYLGTYWQVGDAAAATFAALVYGLLASGGSLDEAVRQARAALLKNGRQDWGNYLLYGDGRFHLVTG